MTGRRRGGGRIGTDDAEIWRRYADSIEPLKRRRPAPVLEDEPVETAKPSSRPARKTARPTPTPLAADTARQIRSDPALTGIDRRTRQKLARGQVEIDARIDLHGTTRATARGRLLGFLGDARARGHRNVLVITGKGEAPYARHTLHGADHFHDPDRRGVLRQAVTEWLAEPDFTALVSGFQPAHPKHGGGGAFYVRLRRFRPKP